jgi:hypothetical protein
MHRPANYLTALQNLFPLAQMSVFELHHVLLKVLVCCAFHSPVHRSTATWELKNLLSLMRRFLLLSNNYLTAFRGQDFPSTLTCV